MKLALCLAGLMVVATVTNAQVIFETGFEQPTYSLGDVSGQDGWMVTPEGAVGTIEGSIFRSGAQALELIDAASFGRAQRNVSGGTLDSIIIASYDMFFTSAWAQQQDVDRFEAQARLELTGAPGTFGVEFGLVKAPAGGYQGVSPNGSALYFEVGTESTQLGGVYTEVDLANYAGSWHSYKMVFDLPSNDFRLYVDDVLRGQAVITVDALSISGLQLQNQRWGTNPSNNAPLYFDNLHLATVPEPTSVVALVLGVGALAVRRRRNK